MPRTALTSNATRLVWIRQIRVHGPSDPPGRAHLAVPASADGCLDSCDQRVSVPTGPGPLAADVALAPIVPDIVPAVPPLGRRPGRPARRPPPSRPTANVRGQAGRRAGFGDGGDQGDAEGGDGRVGRRRGWLRLGLARDECGRGGVKAGPRAGMSFDLSIVRLPRCSGC